MHIERISDVDTLRKVAVLLDRQVRTLSAHVRELVEENARLKGQDARAIQREIEALKELLAQRERVIFAEKTEPGSRYSPAFAVEVAVNKYLDHLPLERQARIMRREGLTVDSQTLWDQLDVLATVLRPTYEALGRHVLEAEVVGADETWWRLMDTKGSKRWWVWSVTRDDAVIYKTLPSRSREAAGPVLHGYPGIVMADGYTAYDALSRAGPSFTLAHCWAHVRRKFIEAEPHFPDPCRQVLDLIGQLYAVEGEVPTPSDPADRAAALALRHGLRQERSRPLVRAIRDWALAQRPLPESSLGKAG